MLFALMHPVPWQTFVFASVAGVSLDGPFSLWDWEFDVCFTQEHADMWTHLRTAHFYITTGCRGAEGAAAPPGM